MFTGLVEASGIVDSIELRGDQARLVLEIPFARELELGESVAINGCCLTVADISDALVSFDVLKQTLDVTSLGELKKNSVVNLERAMIAGGRLGGHIVQGHVDATGEIIDFSALGQDHRLEVKLPGSIYQFCIDKGSLTIDGISLTIAELKDSSAVFWIIPHTTEVTNLSEAKVGKLVNLEADVIAKHVKNLLKHHLS